MANSETIQQHVILDESNRQMILMALAHLAVERPGWEWTLSELAKTLDNVSADGRPETFDQLKLYHQQEVDSGTTVYNSLDRTWFVQTKSESSLRT